MELVKNGSFYVKGSEGYAAFEIYESGNGFKGFAQWGGFDSSYATIEAEGKTVTEVYDKLYYDYHPMSID